MEFTYLQEFSHTVPGGPRKSPDNNDYDLCCLLLISPKWVHCFHVVFSLDFGTNEMFLKLHLFLDRRIVQIHGRSGDTRIHVIFVDLTQTQTLPQVFLYLIPVITHAMLCEIMFFQGKITAENLGTALNIAPIIVVYWHMELGTVVCHFAFAKTIQSVFTWHCFTFTDISIMGIDGLLCLFLALQLALKCNIPWVDVIGIVHLPGDKP